MFIFIEVLKSWIHVIVVILMQLVIQITWTLMNFRKFHILFDYFFWLSELD